VERINRRLFCIFCGKESRACFEFSVEKNQKQVFFLWKRIKFCLLHQSHFSLAKMAWHSL
jgi:hypothetical protein